MSCTFGHIDIAKWLLLISKQDYSIKININNENDEAFRVSCNCGYKDIAEWLYLISKVDGNAKVLINGRNDSAFRYSYKNGRKGTAEWLYNLSKIDSYAFKWACYKTTKILQSGCAHWIAITKLSTLVEGKWSHTFKNKLLIGIKA
jgi:hypothetical protein